MQANVQYFALCWSTLVSPRRLSRCPPQALGMLLWHKHDVERSLADLANFTPFPEEWSTEDKVMFEQAFGFHGKSFHRIQQMVRQREQRDTLFLFFPFFLKWCHGKKIQYLPLKNKVIAALQIPDKLIPSLVKYYYSWKKTRTRTSVMDRQARKLVSKREKEDR